MEYAAEGGHRELVDLFISKGANHWNRLWVVQRKEGIEELRGPLYF